MCNFASIGENRLIYTIFSELRLRMRRCRCAKVPIDTNKRAAFGVNARFHFGAKPKFLHVVDIHFDVGVEMKFRFIAGMQFRTYR